MSFDSVNWLGILGATVGGYVFGAIYYSVLSKPWMAAVEFTERPKPAPGPLITAFVAQLVMATMLFGVVGHLGDVNPRRAIISALFIWVGFIVTTMIVNHRFQGAKWSLTMIDAGHWLGVLLVMAVILGMFGLA